MYDAWETQFSGAAPYLHGHDQGRVVFVTSLLNMMRQRDTVLGRSSTTSQAWSGTFEVCLAQACYNDA